MKEAECRDGRSWRLFTEDDVASIRNEAGKITAPTGRAQRNPADSMPRILVVDDEPAVGQLFKETLRLHDYRVTTISDSREALEVMTNTRFDLIFLDLKMPGVDGSQLLQRIKEKDNHARVAIITGYPESELMDRAMEHGPLLVMKKPFGSGDILNAVRLLLPSMATDSSRTSSGEGWQRGTDGAS